MKRKDFVKNLRDYDSFQFLKKYDIDSLKKPKIMSRKEGMDFVVTSLFRSVGHLNMAEIEEEDFDLLNKSLFKDCKAGHCKNNHKFTQIVWESKGEVEGPPDTNSVNQTRPMPFIKNYKPEKRMVPRAKIRFNECKCSQSQGEYELLDYKDDWEGYPVSKNKDIQPLFEKYFSLKYY